MTLKSKTRKILIPDVPPPTADTHEDLLIAGIGLVCATFVIAALVFVFFGA